MKKSSRHNSYFILYQTVRRIYTKQCGIVPLLHFYSDLYNHSHFCIHNSEACCSAVQNGSHGPSLLPIQPQLPGDGYFCSLSRACPQQYPAWYAALLMCCCNAEEQGGILSMDLPFLVNKSFLAASTRKHSLFLSYSRTTKRSMFSTDSLTQSSLGLSLSKLNSLVTSL